MRPLRDVVGVAAARVAWTVVALASISISACVGKVGPTTATGDTGPSPGVAPIISSDITVSGGAADAVAQAPTRRLSNVEIANAFQVLTGATSVAATTLPADSFSNAFDRVVQSQTVIDRTVQALIAIGDEAATLLTDSALAKWSSACAVQGALGTDGAALSASRRPCAQGLLTTWAQTAYRRPLTSDEQTALLALYDAAGTYRDGINQLVRFVMESPSFLYVIEHGTADPNHAGMFALNDYEIATRLSLLFCETLPDSTLMTAAAKGGLQDPAAVMAQAERLFNLPCAHTTVQHFYAQWLNLISVPALAPNTTTYPGFNAGVRTGMLVEDQTFFDQMTFTNNATLPDLFHADYTYADQSLADIYGITGLGPTAEKVMLPPERRGFLTHPSVLALTSHTDRTSPVRRGVYVIRNLLCLPMQNPPQNVNTTLPPIDPTLTARQQFEALTQQSVCQTCHGELNPIGFGMEDFDGIGQHRTTDGTLPLDDSGSVPAIGVGDFNGAAALSEAIADRPELQLCFARKWLRFGLGRLEGQPDESSLGALVQMQQSGSSLHDVMVGVTGTYAFTHRSPPPN